MSVQLAQGLQERYLIGLVDCQPVPLVPVVLRQLELDLVAKQAGQTESQGHQSHCYQMANSDLVHLVADQVEASLIQAQLVPDLAVALLA